MGARQFFDRIEPHFEKGGKWEKFFPLYEMVESFLYTPKTVTKAAPHARSFVDMKRIMTYVVLATVPCILVGLWNVGYQANAAIASGLEPSGWRAAIAGIFGYNPSNPIANFMHGLMYFLPIYITTLVVGGFWEVVFATIRRHEVNEGFLVTSMLYVLILPATTPLWMVALGISFGVVIGKEVFGGTGKNFLNPALTARAFLYFAYPAAMSGDAVWVPVDGYSGATALAVSAQQGYQELSSIGVTWWSGFLGNIEGSMGETSTLACAARAVLLAGDAHCQLAAHRRLYGRDDRFLDTAEHHRIGHQPDVRHALVLASGAWRLCLWPGLYGDRAGLREPHQYGPLHLWRVDRRDGGADPGREPGLSRGHDARHSLCQHLRPADRPFRRPGQYPTEGQSSCLTRLTRRAARSAAFLRRPRMGP